MKKIFLLLISCFFALSCSNGTDDNLSKIITGKVVDEFNNPIPDVEVKVYDALNINEIKNIKSQTLGVGFTEYQNLSFNPLNQSLKGSAKTNSSGMFSVDVKSSSEFYTIKLEKENYGQNLYTGLNNTEVGQLICVEDSLLHDEEMLNYFLVNDTMRFNKNVVYQIQDEEDVNVFLLGDGFVLFEEGSKIVLGANSTLKISAKNLKINGSKNNPVVIISENVDSWDKIEIKLTGSNCNVSYLSCLNGEDGLIIKGNSNVKINSSSFYEIEQGISFLTSKDISLSKNIISSCDYGFILSSGIDSSRIDSNIFINCNYPLRVEGQGFDDALGESPIFSKITNNYFYNSDVVIDAVTINLYTMNNTIDNCSVAMNYENGCRGIVQNNVITNVKNSNLNIKNIIYAWGLYETRFYPPYGYISDNNFQRSILGNYSLINDDLSDLNAENNYWYTTNYDTLESIIKHSTDFSFVNPKGIVDFEPYKTSEILNIGAQ